MTWPSLATAIASMILGWTPALLSLAKLRDGLPCLVMTNCLRTYLMDPVLCTLCFVLCFACALDPNSRFDEAQSTKYKAQRSRLSSFEIFDDLSCRIRA